MTSRLPNGSEEYAVRAVYKDELYTGTKLKTFSEADLAATDLSKVSSALNEEIDPNSLTLLEVSTLLAIDKGLLDKPRTVFLGNSLLKDREFIDEFISANTRRDIRNPKETLSAPSLPDFYTFESEDEAIKYCKDFGAYEEALTVHPHHLQVLAFTKRLDLIAYDNAKSTYEETLEQYPQSNAKLDKYVDNSAKDFIRQNKDELLEAIRVLGDIERNPSHDTQLNDSTLEKVEKLLNSQDYIHTIMSKDVFSTALQIERNTASTLGNGSMPTAHDHLSLVHSVSSESIAKAIGFEIESRGFKVLSEQAKNLVNECGGSRRILLGYPEMKERLFKDSLKALSANKEPSLDI